uniref:Hemoglobin alpha embryonic-4 n=1 Tax=Acanthochromis polyacanthus TaxID=80966 RepID=A0A3Q1HDS3_9TELE
MLKKKEKALIKQTWDKLTPVAEDIGADALLRMFAAYPGSKTYFSHVDISPGSPHLLSHGKKIVLAIAEAAKDISQLTVTLAPLQTFHAYQLRIDPTNFKVPFLKLGVAPVYSCKTILLILVFIQHIFSIQYSHICCMK